VDNFKTEKKPTTFWKSITKVNTFHFYTPAVPPPEAPEAKMAAMFSQNPLMNGPNYSFNQAPSTATAGNKEHAFYP
jgi:20S proteasome subunit beta 6